MTVDEATQFGDVTATLKSGASQEQVCFMEALATSALRHMWIQGKITHTRKLLERTSISVVHGCIVTCWG